MTDLVTLGAYIRKKVMPITILKYKKDPLAALVEQLRVGRLQDQLVLVSTVHDKRLLQSDLAVVFNGLLPKIEVLTHQLAQWLKFGVADASDKMFLTPRERRFAMDRWNLSGQKGLTETQLDHMQDVLNWAYQHGVEITSILNVAPQIGAHFSDFLGWCKSQHWIDRASLHEVAHQVPPHSFDRPVIHLFQLGRLQRNQILALDALIANGGKSCKWFVHRSLGPQMSTGLQMDIDNVTTIEELDRVSVQILKVVHPRLEVETVLRNVKRQVIDSDGSTFFSDFVLLLADFESYSPIVKLMAENSEVPVTLARGAKEIGDPAISRFRTWLYLGLNGFQLDDVLQVYGDGVIPLVEAGQDDLKTPNLRTFGSFCKKYNIRTIHQLESELDRAIVREVRSRDDRSRRKGLDPILHPSDFEDRHGNFYRAICGHLVDLMKSYPVSSRPLSEWLEWVKERIASLGTIKNDRLMAASKRLIKAAGVGITTVSRVGFDPEVDAAGFSKVFDGLLDGAMPVEQHPGRVLVGSVNDLTYVKGKHVFILGMSDSSFPVQERSEELFASLGEAGSTWARSLETDPLASAGAWLTSISSQASSLCLSYVKDDATNHAMPSVFVSDTTQLLPWWDICEFSEEADDRCFDSLNWMLHHRTSGWDPQRDNLEVVNLASLSRHSHAVTKLRESPSRITVWDGMLADVREDWSDTAQKVVSTAIQFLKSDDTLRISVSQLDSFAESPLEYFFRRLLRIEPPAEYLDEAEQNKKGNVLHTILDRFYSDTDNHGGIIDPILEEDKARLRILAIASDVFDEHPEDLGNPETPFPDILKTMIEKTLNAFIDAEHEGLKQINQSLIGSVRPATIRDPKLGSVVTEVPFEYELDIDGNHVLINGFIDRIDTDADNTIQVIYDYKTGSTYSVKQFESMNSGMSFQLPVYLYARKGDSDSKILAGYYHIELSKAGKDIRLKGMLGHQSITSVKATDLRYKDNHGLLDDDRLNEFLGLLQEKRIKPAVRLILNGRFHQSLTKPSEYSDYKRMSRWSESVNELRKLTLLREFSDEDQIFDHYYVKVDVLPAKTEQGDEGEIN